MGLAGDLAAEDEAGFTAGAYLVQRRVIVVLHFHAEPADVGGHLEQVVGTEQVVLSGGHAGSPLTGQRPPRQARTIAPGLIQVALDVVDHGLGGGQVAGGQKHEQPVGSRLEGVQLSVRRDVVDPGVGAGIGGHHQTGLQPEPHAIGHSVGASAEQTLQASGHGAHR